MDFLVFIAVIIVLSAIGLPVALIVLYRNTGRKTESLQRQIDGLRIEIDELRSPPLVTPVESVEAELADEPVEVKPSAETAAEPETSEVEGPPLPAAASITPSAASSIPS
ncbi:MAG: hypothetical protein GY896_08500, partial [Gammaproteobacteria bacterium]|nr:hypothetical protein [Gammaproteobacteria bacterium]